jgi:hypothetical protein
MVMVYLGLVGTGGGQEESVLCNDIGFSQGKFPVEDIEEFPFYAADITPSKQPCPRRPIGVLWRGIVGILVNRKPISKKK